MAVPLIHAESSARKFGGVADDYLDIHVLMDSTKATFPDNRHRVITHNSWFTTNIIPMIFGHERTNSAGKKYSTKNVAELHVLEDFRMRFIPSIQDYVSNMSYEPWMNNGFGELPDSAKLRKNDQGGNTSVTISIID